MATARSSCLTSRGIITPSNVIKDSTIQSKAKQNTRARASCQLMATTQQWGYSFDSGHVMIQRRPRRHVSQGGLTHSLCSNRICAHCLSCMKNLHSGDWFSMWQQLIGTETTEWCKCSGYFLSPFFLFTGWWTKLNGKPILQNLK